MESIAEKIEKIYESKIAIKNSLINKGLKVDDTLGDYAAAIDSLSVGASVATSTENLTTEDKKDGDIVVVYDSSSTDATATVFKIVDSNTDKYYINGKLWSVPCLSTVIKECDKNNYQQYILAIMSYDMSHEPYIALEYRFISLYNDKTWFYTIKGSSSGAGLLIANANSEEVQIYFANYSKNGNVMGIVETLTLAAGSEESPSRTSTGLLAISTMNTQVGDYINCVCYSDINKTNIMYNSSTFEKCEPNLEYTQIS